MKQNLIRKFAKVINTDTKDKETLKKKKNDKKLPNSD